MSSRVSAFSAPSHFGVAMFVRMTTAKSAAGSNRIRAMFMPLEPP